MSYDTRQFIRNFVNYFLTLAILTLAAKGLTLSFG